MMGNLVGLGYLIISELDIHKRVHYPFIEFIYS
jgi:hypothetical protein